jgi:hypothetical protein
MRKHYRLLTPVAALAVAAAVAGPLIPAAQAHDTGGARPRTPTELKSAVSERASALHRQLARSAPSATDAATSAAPAAALPPGGIGNDIFHVYVEENPGLGVGTFTVLTGPGNAAGAARNVLFGDGIPGTSYLIIRDEAPDGTITDYVQGQLLTHPTEVSLDDYFSDITPLGTTGYRTTWFGLPSGTLTQDIVVHGTTQGDSSVEVTVRVEPSVESADHTFTVQYLWDVALGEDDGPALQPQPAGAEFRPTSPVVPNEATLADSDDSLAVVDNDANLATPTLAIGTTISGPAWVTPAPTTPDTTTYVCWPQAIYAPIGEYQPDPTLDISTPASSCKGPEGGNDSAIEHIWTAQGTGPITVSASLFMSPRTAYSTAMTATPVLLRSPAFSASLTDSAGQPIPDRPIAFSVGSTIRCTAVTNANGVARCGTLGDALAATLALGYTARYAGGSIWAPVSARGALV